MLRSNKIRVHRNLHKARAGGPQWVVTKRGRVVEYLDRAVLVNITTRVQPGGLRRCRKKQVRNVCGFLDGEGVTRRPAGEGWMPIQFDPRKDLAFLACGKPWNRAAAVVLEQDGKAWVLAPTWEGEPPLAPRP
jgi:hypothetical protein